MAKTLDTDMEVHPQLTAGLLEENIGMNCYPELPLLERQVIKVPFNRSSLPKVVQRVQRCWFLVMSAIMSPLVALWERQGYGLKVNGFCLTHWIWADNKKKQNK